MSVSPGRRILTRLALLPLLLVTAPGAVRAQALRGIVRDSVAGAPLPDVRIELSGAGTGRVTFSDAQGAFTFPGLTGGPYRLRLSRVGYRAREVDTQPGVPLTVWLVALGAPLDPVVVSASRRAEAALEAPAAVTVLGRSTMRESPALEPLNAVSRAPGVNAAQKGLVQQTFSARGANTVNSGALLLLHDFRYAAIPSVAFNIPYLVPATADDVDRLEVIRGPAAALYGPGAPAGVVHLLTRSPLDEPGGSLTLTGGSRTVLGTGARYAARLSGTLGLKLSGEYLRGDDWGLIDAREAANRDTALAGGASRDTLLVGRRDSTVERALGDARLDWRPAPGTDITVAAGATQALRAIDLTPALGAIQGRDWRYSYAQLRARRGRLFVNALYNWSNAGDTYVLRTGERLVDDSRVLVAQVQHGATLGAADLLYGADARWTDPRTGGTIHGANEDDDLVAELGAYFHGDAPLGGSARLIGALRVDHHNRLHDLVLSPRVGVVVRPGATHAVRLTYNRAFTSPDANDLFLDVVADRYPVFDGIGYTVRGAGVPRGGFTFRRDCAGGLCMRSPFYLAEPGAYLPLDATRLWPAVVALAGQQGVDLSGVPPPDADDVGTVLAVLDPGASTPRFVPVNPDDVTDVAEEGRTITNVVELGYRGTLARRLDVTLDLWVNRVHNLAGPLIAATPNAFFDSTSLADYLSAYLAPAEAQGLAAIVSAIPAGTVTPQESRYPYDVLVMNRRGGSYTLWGADLALAVTVAPGVTARASYSWTSHDTIPDVRDVGTVFFNAPRSGGTFGASYRREGGLALAAAGRWVTAFPVNSGVYAGRVGGYVAVDATVELPVPGWRAAAVQFVGQNLVGGRHREIIGAPAVGRLVLARLRLDF